MPSKFEFEQVAIAVDVAASEFGQEGRYTLGLDRRVYRTEEWLEVLVGWLRTYPIVSIEDPFAEDDTVGMVGPMLLLEDGRIQSAGHINDPTPRHLGVARVAHDRAD